jgi:ATP-binding cassette subfamily C protein
VARDASIELDAVSFGYQAGAPVLRDVRLAIAPGEHVALVGPSGAGKTTLAKLVAGVHPAGHGAIRLGGVAIERIDPACLTGTVALVTQEVHVFAGTLADDLRLARPTASEDELTDALRTVGALPWVSALPEGLRRVVGDGGHRLSAGQAQQLALARVLLAVPPIVVLDEASADAGSAGARELDAAAEQVMRGRTALVVAHRLSQAAQCDRVVVLADGEVVEAGSHGELAAAGGRYFEAWRA